jgi:hypothetical protein
LTGSQAKARRKISFISYTSADKSWAEWIAWELEQPKFSVVIQACDFRPRGNFVSDMKAARSDHHVMYRRRHRFGGPKIARAAVALPSVADSVRPGFLLELVS